jgi:hypothetical protein
MKRLRIFTLEQAAERLQRLGCPDAIVAKHVSALKRARAPKVPTVAESKRKLPDHVVVHKRGPKLFTTWR